MTTQNLTIKDLVGIHRSFTDEYTIIEIVREMATESYCALLYQQLDDPSEEVEMVTAIECLMCKLDEYVEEGWSAFYESGTRVLETEELMRMRDIRRSYNILRACLTHIGQMKIEKIATQKSEPEPESESESGWGWDDDGRDLPEDHPYCFVTVESCYGKDRY